MCALFRAASKESTQETKVRCFVWKNTITLGATEKKNQFPAKIEKCHIMSHPQSITGSSFSGSFFIDVYFAFAAAGAQLHKLTLWKIVASEGICYEPCLQKKNIASNLIEFS